MVVICMAASFAVAQPNEPMPKAFKNFGWSGLFLFDFSTTVVNSPDLLGQDAYYSSITPSVYTISWGWRWNLAELNDHLSFSIETEPMLGFSYSTVSTNAGDFNGFMNFDLPIMLGINSGTAATFRSIELKGFAYNIGVNFVQSPLVGITIDEGSYLGPQMTVCSSLKFRSWTYKNAPEGRGREVELFVALGKQYESTEIPADAPGFLSNRPAHFAIVFRKMLNY